MKINTIINFLFLVVFFLLNSIPPTLAQTLTPRVICSGYGSGQGGGIKLNYTVGETFVTTLRNGNTVLTQGFHQPEIDNCELTFYLANTDTIHICSGDSVTVATGYQTFSWNTGEETQSITPLSEGWYICTVTLQNCSGTDSVYVQFIAPTTYYPDNDGDGFGNFEMPTDICGDVPVGYTLDNTDCNDADALIYPHAPCNDNNPCTINDIIQSDCTCSGENLGAPAAPTAISGPNGVCRNSSGQVFTVTPITGATSYLWTLPSGATGTSSTNSITLSFSSNYNTGNICVKAVNACGQSASYCRSVAAYTTNPTTPGNISGPSTSVCAGTTQTYSIASVSNATSYQWTAPANASIVSGQGTNTVVVLFSSSFNTNGALYVRSVNCFGNSSNRRLSIFSTPSTPVTLNGQTNNVCPGSVLTYAVAAVAGASGYTWTAPANSTITSGQGTSSITLTIGSAFTSGNLSVVANSSCGQSLPRTVTISKNPSTLGVITGQIGNLCGGGQFTYSVNPVAGAISHNWIVPSGCTLVSNNGNSITLNIPTSFISGTLSVTAVNSCGGSVSRSVSLSRLPSAPSAISGPSSSCPNQSGLLFTTTATAGLTQTWTVPTGVNITAGQGTASMTSTWGSASGSVSVRNVNACGSSVSVFKPVYIATCMEVEESISPISGSSIYVYPNPSRGEVTIMSGGFAQGIILNPLGQHVLSFQLDEANNYKIQLNELSAGLYLVNNILDDQPSIRLIIVK